MEFFKSWYNVIWLIFSLSSTSFLQASYGYDPESLSTFFHHYANTSVSNPHTGILYNLSLPANFSGMEASFARILSAKFLSRGVNFSSVYIPPRVIPMPYVKRLTIVYENLGNWSSVYYQVSNYTLVAPVVGFLAYDSNSSAIGTQKLNFSTLGDPIAIQFPHIDVQGEKPKCVEFGVGGSFEIKDMTEANECLTHGEGHFSLVVPSPITPTPTPMPTPTPTPAPKNKDKLRKGLIAGICGMVILGLVMIVMYKLVRRRQIRAMEKQSEKDVAFNTFWVGRSKMPSASMTRTQPYLEQAEYAP
ncbi:hypothetical protein RchiOBHm_Chr1g0358561 [Rosa chinensis]|uniref:Non-specific serine/threonine protein kinase n=1 Tax=Rosa chinensis TaxID=74649 RepID=A0A2P6SI51_ROSCH|nr:uncharacterized protein LOC112181874 [Rosa chinensis]PRQ58369.1 hypothetical protein RchiOBHm_Chr1g0358561 [Rosa chinensis]